MSYGPETVLRGRAWNPAFADGAENIIIPATPNASEISRPPRRKSKIKHPRIQSFVAAALLGESPQHCRQSSSRSSSARASSSSSSSFVDFHPSTSAAISSSFIVVIRQFAFALEGIFMAGLGRRWQLPSARALDAAEDWSPASKDHAFAVRADNRLVQLVVRRRPWPQARHARFHPIRVLPQIIPSGEIRTECIGAAVCHEHTDCQNQIHPDWLFPMHDSSLRVAPHYNLC